MKLSAAVTTGIALISLVLASPALAHSGSGQPYVIINNDWAVANAVSGLDASLPQDLAANPYVVGETLNFGVDLNQLGTPGNVFRWLWSSARDSSSDGPQASHTFDKPGTYTVILQVKNETILDFADLDTIGINIVPKAGYTLPTAKVKVGKITATGKGYDVNFEAVPNSKNLQINWKFGDGGDANGLKVKHHFDGKELRLYPVIYLKDSNNLSAALVFEVDGSDNKLTASELPGQPPVLLQSTEAASRRPWLLWGGITALVLAILLVVAAVWNGRRKPSRDGTAKS